MSAENEENKRDEERREFNSYCFFVFSALFAFSVYGFVSSDPIDHRFDAQLRPREDNE